MYFNPIRSFRSYWALRLTLTLFCGLDRFCAIGHSVRVWRSVLAVTLCSLTKLNYIRESLWGALLCRIFFSTHVNENATSLFSLPICRRYGPCWKSQRRVLSLLVGYYLKLESLICCFRSNFLELNIAKTKQLVLWAPRLISIDNQEVEIVNSCKNSFSQASKQRKQEEQTLRRLKFQCKFTKLVLCLLNAHQSRKAYCAWSF